MPEKRRLIIATGNPHKIEEMAAQLSEWFTLEPLPAGYKAPAEDGDTFAANAKLKALTAAQRLGALCLADDSGLCVDALGGAPGIYSARYAGDGGDGANNAKLLNALSGVPETQRGAHFVCALSLCDERGERLAVTGRFHGRIATASRGDGGFGYDPLFITEDGRSCAELPALEKQRSSHRGVALRALAAQLRAGLLTA